MTRATDVYTDLADRAAGLVISRYSTSFGVASRLFSRPVRRRIATVYALVRVADEIVDQPEWVLPATERGQVLDLLQADLALATQVGHSANLVVHAFARTARQCGITADLTDPFFDSMRTDLHRRDHDPDTYRRYVHGSAEVVGLMCLRVFLTDHPAPGTAGELDELEHGARRLGAAFQELNFLRDLAEDHDVLGRSYLPGVDVDRFSDADRDEVLRRVCADLATAQRVIGRLPGDSRRAVQAAHAVFEELARRLQATPAAEIRRGRVRVPTAVKLRLVAGAVARDGS